MFGLLAFGWGEPESMPTPNPVRPACLCLCMISVQTWKDIKLQLQVALYRDVSILNQSIWWAMMAKLQDKLMIFQCRLASEVFPSWWEMFVWRAYLGGWLNENTVPGKLVCQRRHHIKCHSGTDFTRNESTYTIRCNKHHSAFIMGWIFTTINLSSLIWSWFSVTINCDRKSTNTSTQVWKCTEV